MGWYLLLRLALCTTCLQIEYAKGLMCYQCIYIEGKTDSNCLKPEEKHLVNCSALTPDASQDVNITSWDYCEIAFGCRVNPNLHLNRPSLHRTCSPGKTSASFNLKNLTGGVMKEYVEKDRNSDNVEIRNLHIWMCPNEKCNSDAQFQSYTSIDPKEFLSAICNGYARLGHMALFLVTPFLILLPSGLNEC